MHTAMSQWVADKDSDPPDAGKAIVVIAILGALGFGGYKLYRSYKNKATSKPSVVISNPSGIPGYVLNFQFSGFAPKSTVVASISDVVVIPLSTIPSTSSVGYIFTADINGSGSGSITTSAISAPGPYTLTLIDNSGHKATAQFVILGAG